MKHAQSRSALLILSSHLTSISALLCRHSLNSEHHERQTGNTTSPQQVTRPPAKREGKKKLPLFAASPRFSGCDGWKKPAAPLSCRFVRRGNEMRPFCSISLCARLCFLLLRMSFFFLSFVCSSSSSALPPRFHLPTDSRERRCRVGRRDDRSMLLRMMHRPHIRTESRQSSLRSRLLRESVEHRPFIAASLLTARLLLSLERIAATFLPTAADRREMRQTPLVRTAAETSSSAEEQHCRPRTRRTLGWK